MRKVIFTITVLLLFIAHSNSQGWFQQNSNVGFNVKSVYFADSNTGYAVGDTLGAILKTTNGGINWMKLAAPTSLGMSTVFFLNSNTGFIGGGAGGSACINKTTNGGLIWLLTFPNPIQYVYSIYFIDASTGIAVTGAYSISGGFIFRTTNGGTNWNGVGGFGNAFYSVYFADANTGYACGTPGIIVKSTNGGVNWVQLTSNTTTNLRSIYFVNPQTGWTVGTNSRVYKTTNGGSTWVDLSSNGLCGLHSVYFADALTGWVAGCEGSIHRTTNGGTNWTMQSFATTTYLYSLSFFNAFTGWAVGANGRILKTTTGGLTPITPISTEIPDGYILYQNYPNPFNPMTNIKFQIPKSGFVNMIVYDILGKEIATLVNEELKPGTYEVNWDGSGFTSGVYYYKLVADDYTETRKMVLLK